MQQVFHVYGGLIMELMMFLSQLPASPSSLRVMVWRRMKSAGALGLQNGVWVLPRAPRQERFLQELLEYVQGQGASGQLFAVQPLSEAVEIDILERFRSDRQREYDEYTEQCQAFLAEIEKETSKRKFTFAELEENEQDLQKLGSWLEKIQGRDFFELDRASLAAAELEECRAAFERFASQVYAQDGLDTDDTRE